MVEVGFFLYRLRVQNQITFFSITLQIADHHLRKGIHWQLAWAQRIQWKLTLTHVLRDIQAHLTSQ